MAHFEELTPLFTPYKYILVPSAYDSGFIYESLWVRQRHEMTKLATLAGFWLTAEVDCRTALGGAVSRTLARIAVFEIAQRRKSEAAIAALNHSKAHLRNAASRLRQQLTNQQGTLEHVEVLASDVMSADVPPELLEPYERWLSVTAARILDLHNRGELGAAHEPALKALAKKYNALPISCWTEETEMDFREELDHDLPIDFMPF